MAVTVKAKATGSDGKKVAQAFHEVYSKVPKTVKATGKTGEAKRKMMTAIALSKARESGANIPDKSGANFVSRQDLHVAPGEANLGLKRGHGTLPDVAEPSEGKGMSTGRLGSAAELGTGRGLASGTSAKGTQTGVISDGRELNAATGPGPSYEDGEIRGLRPVNRVMNPVERVRQENNRVRDQRTNLGRGKTAIATVE